MGFCDYRSWRTFNAAEGINPASDQVEICEVDFPHLEFNGCAVVFYTDNDFRGIVGFQGNRRIFFGEFYPGCEPQVYEISRFLPLRF